MSFFRGVSSWRCSGIACYGEGGEGWWKEGGGRGRGTAAEAGVSQERTGHVRFVRPPARPCPSVCVNGCVLRI